MKDKGKLITELELEKKARLREREARFEAEKLLEEKTRALYFANQDLTQKVKELEQHTSEIELFLSLSKLSQGKQELNDVLQFLVNAVCKLENWPVGHVFTLKPGSEKILVSSGIWYFDNDKDYHELYEISTALTFEPGKGVPGKTFAMEKPLYIEDVQNDPNYFRTKICKKLDIQSSFAIPLKCNNSVLAVIEFFIRNTNENLQKGFELISSFVRQLETLLERQEAQKEARESSLKLQQALVEVQEMAHQDAVTGLPNRRQFELTLKREIASAKRNNQRLSLLCIDVDHFKSINDHLGHDIGDLLLIEIGNRIQATIREEDFVARLGGDEFSVFLKDVTPQKAGLVANKILQELNAPYYIDNHDVISSVSIGIASFPEAGVDYGTLYKSADIAMYKAKELGRNNYKYFDISVESQYKKRLDIENNIEFALEKNEFSLVYQPIYNLVTQKIFGIEVLLRWNSPKYGLIPPEEFIPIAEEKNTIIMIGEWVLQTACQQYMEWHKEISLDCKLLVNISSRQLKDPKFVEKVLKIIHETRIPFHLLEFEMTETAIMSNPEESEEILKRLNALGIKIAIDDFGTGYSSLNRLKALPVSALKIDKSFIEDIGAKDNNNMIIKSIINLAKELNLETIAEGVEGISQLNFLRENKCPEAQGFYFHHPIDKDEMKKIFLENKPLFPDSPS